MSTNDKQTAPERTGVTSEKHYGVIDQPKPTCPLLDDIISRAKNALNAIKACRKVDDVNELKDFIGDIENYIWDIESLTEDARKNTTLIRDWGEEWKQIVKKQDHGK